MYIEMDTAICYVTCVLRHLGMSDIGGFLVDVSDRWRVQCCVYCGHTGSCTRNIHSADRHRSH